jgi:hypothetical protein
LQLTENTRQNPLADLQVISRILATLNLSGNNQEGGLPIPPSPLPVITAPDR